MHRRLHCDCAIVGPGNPARSAAVREFCTGYRKWMARNGYRQQSANPWQEEDLQEVLEQLDQKIRGTEGVARVKLLRDAFAMTIMWDTCIRGATAVAWRLQDLWTPKGDPEIWRQEVEANSGMVGNRRGGGLGCAGEPAAPLLQPELKIAVGERVLFRAVEIKHNLHPEAMSVARVGGELCPVERLHSLLTASAAVGQPVTTHLCRPLAADKKRFLESSLSVSTLEGDVSKHFKAAGVPYHSTAHGSRRGALQQHADEGAPEGVLAHLAQIKTPEVLKRYLDTTRHMPGMLPKGGRPGKRVCAGQRGEAEAMPEQGDRGVERASEQRHSEAMTT